jgi:hypothetical protein
LAASGEHVLAKRLWQDLGKLLRIQAQPQKRIAYSGNQLRTAATQQAKESSMKRFLLIVTAMALMLAFCGTVMGNYRNGHQFDDRRFDSCPDAFRHYRDDFQPVDFYRHDFRRFSPSPLDFYRDDSRLFDLYWDEFRRFDNYQDDLPLRFNDYCFHHGHTGVIAGIRFEY